MSRERVVIKFGSSSLTTKQGGLDQDKIEQYVHQIIAIIDQGLDPVIVSSGAIAAGYERIGYKQRPRSLAQKQASAAVGQTLLMQTYQEIFARENIVVSQLLLTRQDLSDRNRCHNAFNTLDELLRQGVVPIVNENDSVSIKEIMFGDNDILSAFVANLVKAKQLIVVTDTNGLYTSDPHKNPDAKRINKVENISEQIIDIAGSSHSSIGTGGMRSKVEAARVSVSGGIPFFVGEISSIYPLSAVLKGEGDGTYFVPSSALLPVKKQWLSFHSLINGHVVIDEGAETALLERGKSLLPAGIKEVHGEFHIGDVIEVYNIQGKVLGRGIINYNDWQIKAVKGLNSNDVQKRVQVDKIEVIHRDEWVVAFSGQGVIRND